MCLLVYMRGKGSGRTGCPGRELGWGAGKDSGYGTDPTQLGMPTSLLLKGKPKSRSPGNNSFGSTPMSLKVCPLPSQD